MLKTNIPEQIRKSVSEESVSVIHAPESFRSWVSLGSPLPLDVMLLKLTLNMEQTSTEPTAKQEQMSERDSPKDTDDMASVEESHELGQVQVRPLPRYYFFRSHANSALSPPGSLGLRHP